MLSDGRVQVDTGAGLRLVIRDEAALTPSERAACDALWDRTWPPDPDHVDDPELVVVPFMRALLFAGDGADAGDGPLVAACALIDRRITVDGEPVRIAGLGNVAVDEARRGRGLGGRVVRAAMDDARRRGYACGFCWARSGPPSTARPAAAVRRATVARRVA